MIAWTRSRTLIAAAAIIVATNAVALLGVAYNRAGETESALKLTQRELPSQYYGWHHRDDSGLALTLQWRVLGEEDTDARNFSYGYVGIGGTPAWLDERKLAALGFDVSPPFDGTTARRRFNRASSKEVLLVLELDGPAYREALERTRRYAAHEQTLLEANRGSKEFEERAKNARRILESEERENSRLFAVDAGLDATALRARYPDRARYAIVRGQVQIMVFGPDKAARLRGYVERLSVSQINVPLEFRRVFERESRPDRTLRFEATIAYGKRFEPWIVSASAVAQ